MLEGTPVHNVIPRVHQHAWARICAGLAPSPGTPRAFAQADAALAPSPGAGARPGWVPSTAPAGQVQTPGPPGEPGAGRE